MNATVRLSGRMGGARPGRKVLTLVPAMVAGASHIDHVDVLRSGGAQRVLPSPVMAPSTLGTFLRSFSFGHARQLEAVVGESLRLASATGWGPGEARLVIHVDSTPTPTVGQVPPECTGATSLASPSPWAGSSRRAPQRRGESSASLRLSPGASCRSHRHGRR